MSDTPRTDVYETEYHNTGTHVDEVFDFSRKLERQLNAVAEALKEADRLYANSILKANGIECGKWINAAREALRQLEEK